MFLLNISLQLDEEVVVVVSVATIKEEATTKVEVNITNGMATIKVDKEADITTKEDTIRVNTTKVTISLVAIIKDMNNSIR